MMEKETRILTVVTFVRERKRKRENVERERMSDEEKVRTCLRGKYEPLFTNL